MPSYCYMKEDVLSSISHANVVYGDCLLSYFCPLETTTLIQIQGIIQQTVIRSGTEREEHEKCENGHT